MADTEEVSSTTPSEHPKVEASPATGDVTPEAVAKVSENGELPKEVPQEAPAAVADVPAPPETAPPEPVTSTTEDATEAVTVEATAPAHTEEPVTEEKPVVVPEPEPVVVPEPAPEPVVVPEPAPVVVPEPVPEPVVVPEPEPVVVPEPVPEPVVVPEPVPEPVVEAPVPEPAPEPPVVVEEPPVVAAPPPEPVVVSEPVTVPEEPPKVEEPVVVEPPKVEEPAPAPAPKVEKPEPACEPAPAAPAPPLLMQYSAEHWSPSLLTSQDNTKVSMDSGNKDNMTSGLSAFQRDLLGGSDDDLQFDMQKNPFQSVSLADSMSTGLSHFEDEPVGFGGKPAQMSESPTPDLVQYAHDGDALDSSPFQNFGKAFESAPALSMPPAPAAVAEPVIPPFSSSLQFSTTTAEDEEPGVVPPVLPDILKSSPLNPDKLDSGSSEGSPDTSPIHRRVTESPNIPKALSPNNPFAFDSKISLLKEMAEETEQKAKIEEEEKKKLTPSPLTETFGAFDLVKEAKDTPAMEPPKKQQPLLQQQDDDERDWDPPIKDTAKVADKFECLSFPSRKVQEDSDSECASADSLSPVLEAMAKNPTSFQVESDKVKMMPKDDNKEVVEAMEEASEPEVSSEEFEFVERPPRGAIDEFLETLDSSKFSKTPEFTSREEPTSRFDKEDLLAGVSSTTTTITTSKESATSQSSSYLLLTDPSGKSSPQLSKAGLELGDLHESLSKPTPPPPQPQPSTETAKKIVERTGLKVPVLTPGAVVDLLYWRDVKTSGAVFGAFMLLLLSLTVCSIITVLSYVALALLSVTVTFRIYKGVMQAIQKSDEGHPFKAYLEKEMALSEELVNKYSDSALGKLNGVIIELRRLFLVEDLVDSLKFAVFMWILTYVGALFNGLTLLILGLIAAFSCPIVYEKHQTQIDQQLAMINNQIKDVVGKVQAKVPGLKKKAE